MKSQRIDRKVSLLAVALVVALAAILFAPTPAPAAEAPATVALVNPDNGKWLVQFADGSTAEFFYGIGGDTPIVGDWDCDGVDTPGMYRESKGFAYLRNSNSTGLADVSFHFGIPGDIPLAGDWDGDGCDTLGVYRNGRVYTSNTLGEDGGSFVADNDYYFGVSGDDPFVGDFDADGRDSIGLHREISGLVYFTNQHPSGGAVAPTETFFYFGISGDEVVAGDWIADGVDSIGVFRASDISFYLNYANEVSDADEIVSFGSPEWVPVSGNFTGVVLYPPTANPDELTVTGGGAADGDVLANDESNVPPRVDALPPTLGAELTFPPANGTVELSADGTYTYTHDGSENHEDSFSYIAFDSEGTSLETTVTITVLPVNDKTPVAGDDEYATEEGATLDGASVLANDTDEDVPADVLSAALIKSPAHGEIEMAADGTFTYVHDGSENHEDSFTYAAHDGVHTSEPATVTIAVTPINDQAPTAKDMAIALDEGGSASISAVKGILSVAADGDLPGDELSATLASDPVHGTAVVNADGGFDYTHDDSENFEDSFTFVVFDGVNFSEPYTVDVEIEPVNDNVPVAADMSYTGPAEGGTLYGGGKSAPGLLSEATDADLPGDILTVVLLEGPEHGELLVFADGLFEYNHDDSENHEDSFTFAVTDGEFTSDPATASLEIEPVNDNTPVTNGDVYGVDDELSMIEIGPDDGVLANDSDSDVPADELSVVLVDAPAYHEAFSLASDGSFSYDYDESHEKFKDSFAYEVFDGVNTSDVTTVTIEIGPINDHAPEGETDEYTLDEGATLTVEKGSVLANDSDIDVPADELSAELVSNVEFGELTLNADGTFTYIHDGSEEHSDSFTYQVNDGAFTSEPVAVSLAMNPVNDPPVASGDEASVKENTGLETIVASVSASDPDDESHVYSIASGNEDGKFAIDSATGDISIAATIDFETDATSYTLTVEVADAEPLTDSATVAITITDVNEAPELTVGASYDVDENLGEGTPINGDTPAGSDVDAGDTQAFSVSGSELVAIDEVSGALSLTGAFDHEATPTVEVTVTVTDSGGLTASETIEITINDINEYPEFEDQGMSVDENSEITTLVGAVEAADPEETALTYGITAGNDDGVFAIDTSNGDVKIADNALLDFEKFATSYELTVEVTDATGLTTAATVTVEINDVNEAPSVVLGESYDIDENSTEGTAVTGDAASADDIDAGDSHTYAIVGGTGSLLFDIDEVSGVISVATGALLDHEAVASYTLTIEVADSGELTDSGIITVAINDVNDAPKVVVGATYSVEENSTGGTPVLGDTPAASDDDGVGPGTHTFAIIGGTGSAVFDMDALSGALTVAEGAALDHEVDPSLTLLIEVTDPGDLTGSVEITVAITDAPNDPPVLTVGKAYDVDENSESAAPVNGDTPSASDDDGDVLAFAITGGSGAGLFDIDGETGALSVADGAELNYEDTTSYELEITVSDPTPATDSATITVEVNDVNEAPVIGGEQTYEMSVLAANLDVIGTVEASDVDEGDVLSYGIVDGNPNGVFTILGNGDLRVADNSTVELDQTYVLTIKVTDSGGLTDQEPVTVWINQSPSISDQSFTVPENSPNLTSVAFVAASDPEAPPQDLSFTVTGGTGTTVFALNADTGEITVINQGALDFESGPASYTLDVTVNDGGAGGLSDSAVITISETNVNEAPEVADAGGPYSVPENSPATTAVVGALPAVSDVDSPDSHTWSLDPVSDEFDINPATGALSVKSGASLDFETTSSYALTLKVTDALGLSATAPVTVAINDVNEAPVIDSAGGPYDVDENSPATTPVNGALASASDVDDGDSLTWSLDPVSAEFDIDSETGALSVKAGASLDYEMTTSYALTLKVTDALGLSATAPITVAINDVAEGTSGSIWVTSDNEVDAVYVDGVPLTLAVNSDNWGLASLYSVPLSSGSVIAIKGHDWDSLGWIGIEVEVGGTRYGTGVDDFLIYTETRTSPDGPKETAVPNPDPGPDAEGDPWFSPDYNVNWDVVPPAPPKWNIATGSTPVGIANWAAGTPALRIDHTSETAWVRFIVP